MNNFEWYVNIEGKQWKRGFTTGTCAAAAAKAAVYGLLNQCGTTVVDIVTPRGITLTIPVAESNISEDEVCCGVMKDAGDDPDVTHGLMIYATARWRNEEGVFITGGKGIGIITKPGLQVPVGQAAINPVPQEMIRRSVLDVLPRGCGVNIVISAPMGEEVAKKTLNPVLGITNGISILGTTGIVEPMSEEAFKHSLVPQIEVALANGCSRLVFTPGKIGEHIAQRYHIPAEATVLMSNFIGYMLGEAARLGVKEILLFGHIGKIVKVAGGIFHTHSKIADGRMDIIAAQAAALGASAELVNELLACVTTEAAMPLLAEAGLTEVYHRLAERASLRAERYTHNVVRIGTVMVSMQGEILGIDRNAQRIGGTAGWHIQ
jgi:cobalt-precorrin-5B (C1)-methyltransferase